MPKRDGRRFSVRLETAAGVGVPARSGERRTASSARLTCAVGSLMWPSVGLRARSATAALRLPERTACATRSEMSAAGAPGAAGVARARSTASGLPGCRSVVSARARAGRSCSNVATPVAKASVSRRLGAADLGRGRRELEVDETARVLGIGRLVGARRPVGPLDEAGERLPGAREPDRRRLALEARVRGDVGIRERRQIAMDVVRQGEKTAGEPAVLEDPEEDEAAGPGHGEQGVPEREGVRPGRQWDCRAERRGDRCRGAPRETSSRSGAWPRRPPPTGWGRACRWRRPGDRSPP